MTFSASDQEDILYGLSLRLFLQNLPSLLLISKLTQALSFSEGSCLHLQLFLPCFRYVVQIVAEFSINVLVQSIFSFQSGISSFCTFSWTKLSVKQLFLSFFTYVTLCDFANCYLVYDFFGFSILILKAIDAEHIFINHGLSLKLSISAKLRRTISSHCCFENEPNSPPSNVMVSCSSGKSASAQSSISAVKIDLYLEAKFVRIAVCIFKERLALVAITSGENKIRWAVEEQGESQIQGIPRRWALEATG